MGFSEKLLFSTGPSATPHLSYFTCDQRLGVVSFGHQGGWLKKARRNDFPVNRRFAGGTKRRSGRVPEAENERFEENWQRWFGKEVHLTPFPSFQSWKTWDQVGFHQLWQRFRVLAATGTRKVNPWHEQLFMGDGRLGQIANWREILLQFRGNNYCNVNVGDRIVEGKYSLLWWKYLVLSKYQLL